MKLGFNGSTGTDIYIIEKTVHKENIGKQILCPDCGKHFQSKSRLIQHLGSHKLNIAEDAHEILSCTDSADCKYKTTSKAYLRDHKRRMHIASAIPGQWMCFVEAPRSFLNHHQHQKHQQDHANVKCPECNKSFAADRNMKQHMKRKHSGVQATNISRNSNESIQDENYNPDIINKAVFVYDGWCFAVFIWLFVIDKYYWNIL